MSHTNDEDIIEVVELSNLLGDDLIDNDEVPNWNRHIAITNAMHEAEGVAFATGPGQIP